MPGDKLGPNRERTQAPAARSDLATLPRTLFSHETKAAERADSPVHSLWHLLHLTAGGWGGHHHSGPAAK